jgi:hypothetical protein
MWNFVCLVFENPMCYRIVCFQIPNLGSESRRDTKCHSGSKSNMFRFVAQCYWSHHSSTHVLEWVACYEVITSVMLLIFSKNSQIHTFLYSYTAWWWLAESQNMQLLVWYQNISCVVTGVLGFSESYLPNNVMLCSVGYWWQHEVNYKYRYLLV